jgi:hypothetical protein
MTRISLCREYTKFLLVALSLFVAGFSLAALAKSPQTEKIPKHEDPGSAARRLKKTDVSKNKSLQPKPRVQSQRSNSASHSRFKEKGFSSPKRAVNEGQITLDEKSGKKHEIAHGESRDQEPEAHDSCDVLYPGRPAEVERCKKAQKARELSSRK